MTFFCYLFDIKDVACVLISLLCIARPSSSFAWLLNRVCAVLYTAELQPVIQLNLLIVTNNDDGNKRLHYLPGNLPGRPMATPGS